MDGAHSREDFLCKQPSARIDVKLLSLVLRRKANTYADDNDDRRNNADSNERQLPLHNKSNNECRDEGR